MLQSWTGIVQLGAPLSSSTPFDYKLSDTSPDDCPAVPVPVLVHWMQVVPGTLMYILNTHQDISHSVRQLAGSGS